MFKYKFHFLHGGEIVQKTITCGRELKTKKDMEIVKNRVSLGRNVQIVDYKLMEE